LALKVSSNLIQSVLQKLNFQSNIRTLQKFKNNYDNQKNYPALKIHPNYWDENDFSEFKKIKRLSIF